MLGFWWLIRQRQLLMIHKSYNRKCSLLKYCRDGICWWIAHYKVCEVQCEDNLDNLTENRFVICKHFIFWYLFNIECCSSGSEMMLGVWMLGRLTLVVTRCNMRSRRRVVMVSEWSTELWWHGVLLSLSAQFLSLVTALSSLIVKSSPVNCQHSILWNTVQYCEIQWNTVKYW